MSARLSLHARGDYGDYDDDDDGAVFVGLGSRRACVRNFARTEIFTSEARRAASGVGARSREMEHPSLAHGAASVYWSVNVKAFQKRGRARFVASTRE